MHMAMSPIQGAHPHARLELPAGVSVEGGEKRTRNKALRARSQLGGAILKIAMLAQRHARGRNGLPLGRRSCDGARATSSVSTVATLALRSQESRPQVQSLHEVLQCHPSWAVIDP